MNTIAPLTAEHSLLLVQLYGEPRRRFHNVAHLLDVMRLWSNCIEWKLWSSTKEAFAAGIALAYHDAHYVVGSDVNEETSAAMAMVAAKTYGVDPERVRDMVLATKRHTEDFDTDPDTALLLDIDVARIGRDREEYRLATHELRMEYREVSNRDWLVGRSAFLRSMLARHTIYRTPTAPPGISEQRARENMQAELDYIIPLVQVVEQHVALHGDTGPLLGGLL